MGLGDNDRDTINWLGDYPSRSNSPVNIEKQKKEVKIFLFINYNEKDDAKKLGAKWDSENKKWYAYSNEIYLINKYSKIRNKIYLNVKYNEKDDAKKLGAKWDKENKKWYAYCNEISLIEKWSKSKK